MSHRSMWKMIHVLHLYGNPGLSKDALLHAGIDCIPDTIQPLLSSGVIEEKAEGHYFLSNATLQLLESCVLANRRAMGVDVRVDYPQAFVIMPFSEPWSDVVYRKMIEPALRSAKMDCARGDTTVRVGDLTTNIWNEILRAGLVIADISVPNVNVFYELGLAHAIGKDVLLLKKKDKTLPADFGGAHYYEYDLAELETATSLLANALEQWTMSASAGGIKDLGSRSSASMRSS
jgi:hypothetical protein